MKNKFFEVHEVFYGDGHRYSCIMRKVYAERRPRTRCNKLYRCNVRISYYPTLEEAQLHRDGVQVAAAKA